MKTDRQLLQNWLRERDAEAFRELSLRHSPMVFSTCRRLLGDASTAEDVAQECFCRLAYRLRRPIDSLGAWLHRVATNLSLKRLRSEKRRRGREARFAARKEPGREGHWEEVQAVLARVDAAMAELPDELRQVLVLHFLEGQTQEAIARSTGISRGTVTYRVKKGVERIREILKRRGVPVTTGVLLVVMGEHLAAGPVPPGLAATLGKLALAGPVRSGLITTAGTGLLGGILVMKTKAIAIAALLVFIALLGTWKLLPEGQEEDQPVEVAVPEAPAGLPGPGIPPAAPEDAGLAKQESPAGMVADSPPGASISGTVYDIDTGEGLADVMVTIEAGGEGDGKISAARTGEDGRYRFENLEAGAYKIGRAEFEPNLPRFEDGEYKTVSIGEGQAAEDIDFPVAFGIRVAGRVVDRGGHPVPGANVEGRDRSSHPSLEIYTTDENGDFELFGFRETRGLTLEARKGDDLVSDLFGPQTLSRDGLSGVTLVLHPTGGISGRVVDQAGNALSGIRIGPSPLSDRMMGSRAGTSAGDGSFEISGIAAGKYRVLLLLPGESVYQGAAPPWEELELARGQWIEGMVLVLDLTSRVTGPAISGRVVDESGKPISGAEMELLTPLGLAGHFDRTDGEGLFELAGLKEERYTLRVEHRDYSRTLLESVSAGSRDLEIVLKPRGALEGRVVDENTGDPIGEFEILHLDDYNRYFTGIRREFKIHRSPGGFFRLEKVHPGPATIIVRAPGYGEISVEIPGVNPGETVRGIEVLLPPPSSVEGVVVDTRGRPVADAMIIPGEVSKHENPAADAAGRSDEKGCFYLTDLSPDIEVISAFHIDYAVGSAPVALSSGRKDRITIVLPAGGRVTGTVYFDGNPWPGQEVRFYSNRRILETSTDGTGSFLFKKVAPGPVTLRVLGWLRFEKKSMKRRWLAGRVLVRDEETSRVDFHFRAPGGALEGILKMDGQPCPARVSLYLEASPVHEYRSLRVGSDGVYRFDDVPPGPAFLQVDNWRVNFFRSFQLEVQQGGTTRRDFELSGGLTLRGKVTGAEPGDAVYVYALALPARRKLEGRDPGEWLWKYRAFVAGMTRVPGGGPYRIEGLKEGRHDLIARLGKRYARRSVEVGEGSPQAVDLALEGAVAR